MYHYAGNNPVRYVDPDGNTIHILAGAGICAAYSAVVALYGGKSGKEIAAAAVGGAVFGGMVAATGGLSLGAQLVGGAMAGTTAYLAESAVAGNEATLAGCAVSAVLGTTAVMAGKVLEKAVNNVVAYCLRVPPLKNGDTVYRVYGGDSHADGASWTTKNPGSVRNYRNVAGLPSGGEYGTNTGRFVIEGSVKDASKIATSRKALPLDGNVGGINEYVIPDALKNGVVEIKNISGVNPEF